MFLNNLVPLPYNISVVLVYVYFCCERSFWIHF